MGIGNNYFRKILSECDIKGHSNVIDADITFKRIGALHDFAQDALDAQIWNDMRQYMPHDYGNLQEETQRLNMSVRGEVYAYTPQSDYGHYQYEGKLYVDPVYGKGAMYDPMYGFWSRPGIEKVKTDKDLVYTQPNAHRHWDEYAAEKHFSEWVKVVEAALNK